MIDIPYERDRTFIKLAQSLVILVEGPEDVEYYSRNLSLNPKKVLICNPLSKGHKKKIVIQLTEENRSSKQVVGIIDADFDRIDRISYMENVFLTDSHDREMDIFMSQAFEEHILFYHKPEDIESITSLSFSKFQHFVLKGAFILGLLRYICHKERVNFRKIITFDFNQRFFSGLMARKKYLDVTKTLQSLVGLNNGDSSLRGPLESFYSKYSKKKYDFPQLCNGKDVHKIIVGILNCGEFKRKRKRSGNYKIHYYELEKIFQPHHFQKLNLFSSIMNWNGGVFENCLN